jgi:putative transposase
LPEIHQHVELDALVVMPNHIHTILVLVDNPSPQVQLGEILRRFKSFSARNINGQRKTPGESVWQRNFYERVIRDEKMLIAIREYIELNPSRWSQDSDNPKRIE